jgi:amino acid transporter
VSGPARGPGLAAKATGPFEVLAQSVANIAPSAVMATGAVLIYINAGQGTWLSYVAATLLVLVVGYCLAQFARRSATPGSVYSYTAKGLGPFAGFMSGWGIVIGYGAIAMGSVAGFGLFTGSLLDRVGLDLTGTAGQIALFALCSIAVVWATIMGIRLSTRMGLVLEVASITAIVVVLVITMFDVGFAFDTSQFTLDGSSFDGVTVGIVLAILGFVGFESAASLGAEAADPHRAIPRAILYSAAGAGLLYIVSAYVQVKGLGAGLADSATPLNDMAENAGVGGIAWVIDLGVSASFFACAAASVNAASRIIYAMGREGVMAGAVGATHSKHQTPYVAIGLLAPLMFLVPAVMVMNGTSTVATFAYLGTIGTFGFMVSYALVSIAAPVWLSKIGSAGLTLIAGPVAALAMAYVFYKNVYPAPPEPFNRLPWIFVAMMAVGGVWYTVVRLRNPQAAAALGSFGEPDPPMIHGDSQAAPEAAPA